ncbi:hypothetical protein SAMN06295905_3433 [Devosia lucknowensis]|uniref:Uncharacterized protein n=1 Tax=Devosia lucknowensis TaxID=1096929 RepID=A0A1Y6G8Q8_9HYPH|nr:hypothetical protein [Devosia lucknowensis]SMQ86134.1 hypothetical protein SAMN06295905_3433 [Devosia lucknowensis]
MTKTTLTLAAGLALATLAMVAPSQAATRSVTIGMDTFADRCVQQGGFFEAAAPVLTCHTESVRVDCAFATSHDANCAWPGIDNRVAVNRLIGMGDSSWTSSTGGGVKKGGGIQQPDLPIDNGGGGGGIDLPDLPIKWK